MKDTTTPPVLDAEEMLPSSVKSDIRFFIVSQRVAKHFRGKDPQVLFPALW